MITKGQHGARRESSWICRFQTTPDAFPEVRYCLGHSLLTCSRWRSMLHALFQGSLNAARSCAGIELTLINADGYATAQALVKTGRTATWDSGLPNYFGIRRF